MRPRLRQRLWKGARKVPVRVACDHDCDNADKRCFIQGCAIRRLRQCAVCGDYHCWRHQVSFSHPVLMVWDEHAICSQCGNLFSAQEFAEAFHELDFG